MDFYIAQGISILAGIIAGISMQLKEMKFILIAQISTNALIAGSYFFLDGNSGMFISIIAVIQAIIMFLFNRKGVKPPIYITIFFIILYYASTLIGYKTLLDVFPAFAATFFALSIAFDNPKCYRIFLAINPFLWVIYDIYATAVVNALVHGFIFISSLIAIIKYDIMKKDNNKIAQN